jgi:transcription elongation GreA/GreB family factor
MVVKNQALLTEKAELRRQGQLAEQTEQELAKKSQVFQKTIKNLVRQLVAQHSQLSACTGPWCLW